MTSVTLTVLALGPVGLLRVTAMALLALRFDFLVSGVGRVDLFAWTSRLLFVLTTQGVRELGLAVDRWMALLFVRLLNTVLTRLV